MKCPWILCTAFALLLLMSEGYANNRIPSRHDFKDEILSARFSALSLPMDVKFDQEIASCIKSYLREGRRESEKILGRATLYFPIFEHYLKVYELPEMLKYLPIVESRLLADVTSSVGAGGLWQFMPETAEMYRLEVNEYVDERLSPHRSTEKAVQYLADLYEEFGDWLLTLAAYNCGPGRVYRAMQSERCSNYWDIKHRLPEQTQAYIPRYLAVVYVFHYYGLYDLQPRFPHADLRYTRTVRVYEPLTFKHIADVCRLSESTLHSLNPGFVEGIIPYSRRGHILTIPARVMPLFRYHFVDKMGGSVMAKRVIPLVVPVDRYVVDAGDSLELIAQNYDCRVEDLMRWNNLRQPDILVNQELKLYPAGTLYGQSRS